MFVCCLIVVRALLEKSEVNSPSVGTIPLNRGTGGGISPFHFRVQRYDIPIAVYECFRIFFSSEAKKMQLLSKGGLLLINGRLLLIKGWLVLSGWSYCHIVKLSNSVSQKKVQKVPLLNKYIYIYLIVSRNGVFFHFQV